jgi:hypothetical protein
MIAAREAFFDGLWIGLIGIALAFATLFAMYL